MIVVHVVEPFASGVAVFVKLLTESMPDDQHIIVHGERAQVKPADEVKKEFESSNVRFIKWKSASRSVNPIKDVMALTELYNILARLKAKGMVDAVHLHSSKSGLLGRIAAKLAGVSQVFYTPNGASFLSSKSKLGILLFKTIEKVGSLFGGKLVCCSPSEYEAYKSLGVEATYINNGIQLSGSMVPSSPVLPAPQFTVVTSGRIDDQKNPALFNQIALALSDMKEFRFVWIGDGVQRNLLTAPNIEVTGWCSKEEVLERVNRSQVYLSTSKYEGLSFSVMEALSLEKPVLLSNCTGNVDMVRKGLNGDLFHNASEAIVRLLSYYNNPEMLRIMGEHSAAICDADYDMEVNFRRYRVLYTGRRDQTKLPAREWSFS